MSQRKWLYVFDPTALRHIVLKDQGTYDQIPWLIECVYENHVFFSTSQPLIESSSRSTRLLLGAGILGVLGRYILSVSCVTDMFHADVLT